MVEVVVSKSGSCEPRMARPKGKGLAVPRIREVPAVAMRAWVMDIIDGNWSSVVNHQFWLINLKCQLFDSLVAVQYFLSPVTVCTLFRRYTEKISYKT
jgi:hypothetical protein